MNAKTILAVVLGTVTHFILGFLSYGLLLMDFMAANTKEYEGLMVEGAGAMGGYVLSSIFYAILLTYILKKSGVASASDGLMTSGIVTFLFAITIDSMFYFGMDLYTGTLVIVDIIAFTIVGGLTGWVIGWALNRGKAATTSWAAVA